MTSRTRERYASPQLQFGVELYAPVQACIPGSGAPVLLRRWTWGRWVVSECPLCRCTPDRPCTITLQGECGEAACVPPGAYELAVCSNCYQGTT